MITRKLPAALASAAIMVLIGAGPAGAVNKGNTGCGLGYVFFKDARDSFATQLLAVTTNSLSTQTFGILTETFGCKQPSSLVSDERLNEFVAGNMDGLASDMAAGQGESLMTLAELMDVPEGQRPGFYATLKDNFGQIFTREDIQSAELIGNILRAAG